MDNLDENGDPTTEGERREIQSPDTSGLYMRGARNGSMWSSVFLNITAILGPAVLGFPLAMTYLGWGLGLAVLVMSWVITGYTLGQMVEMHENEDGERFNTYQKLGQETLGETLGTWLVLPQQLIVCIGGDILYMIIGGQSLWLFYIFMLHCGPPTSSLHIIADGYPFFLQEFNICGGPLKLGKTAYTIFFALPQFFLAYFANFNSLGSLYILATCTAFGYCTLAWILCLFAYANNKVQLGNGNILSEVYGLYEFPQQLMGMGNLMVVIHVIGSYQLYAMPMFEMMENFVKENQLQSVINDAVEKFELSSVINYVMKLFPIQSTQEVRPGSTGEGPSQDECIIGATIVTGEVSTEGDSHERKPPTEGKSTADGSAQNDSSPVTSIPQIFSFNGPVNRPTSSEPSLELSMGMRILTRSIYVAFTAFVACVLPCFYDLIALFGGFAPSAYVLPCIMWLSLKKPGYFTVDWLINWALIFIGVVLTILSFIGAVWNIPRNQDCFLTSTLLTGGLSCT
ncbi:unnamed protein product [Calypogeia fissa]